MTTSMFWNWLRWQCLNKQWIWADEIPPGTIIDEDQATMERLKLLYVRKDKDK